MAITGRVLKVGTREDKRDPPRASLLYLNAGWWVPLRFNLPQRSALSSLFSITSVISSGLHNRDYRTLRQTLSYYAHVKLYQNDGYSPSTPLLSTTSIQCKACFTSICSLYPLDSKRLNTKNLIFKPQTLHSSLLAGARKSHKTSEPPAMLRR